MIQSLLTQEEYDKYSKIYNTYNPAKRRAANPIRLVKIDGKEFWCGPPPNYLMGSGYSPKEAQIANKKLEELKKFLKEQSAKAPHQRQQAD